MSIFETTLPFERLYTTNDEDDIPCDICGEFPEDCECPECAECGEVGNPNCIDKHMPSEMWTTKTRLCTICGKNDPDSFHVQTNLSHDDGYIPICRKCWKQSEEATQEFEESFETN